MGSVDRFYHCNDCYGHSGLYFGVYPCESTDSLWPLMYASPLQFNPSTNREQAPPGDFKTKWEHNLTFTQKPDAESEAVWSSIIPVGRGFIHHPQLAPFVSNIAVFHQLHCLVSLRGSDSHFPNTDNFLACDVLRLLRCT